jgi:ankyrin repeat protein
LEAAVGEANPYIQAEEAIDEGDIANLRAVLSRDVDYLKAQNWLNDLLRHAARRDRVEAMAALVEYGADINARQLNGSPEGPIYDAAGNGTAGAVRWLLEHGAKVNHEVGGETRCFALTRAVRGGYIDVVKLLVDYGAAINCVWGGYSPLSYAIMYGQKDVEIYLRSRGAKEPRELRGKS